MLKKLLPSLLALTVGVSLAGCAGLPTSAIDPLTSGLSSQQGASVNAMVTDTVAAMQSSSDMSVASGLSGTVTVMSVQALDGQAAASGSAQTSASGSLEASKSVATPQFQSRLQAERGAVRSVTRETINNPPGYASGSVMVKVTLKLDSKGGTQTHVNEKVTLNGDLIAEIHDFDKINKKGHKIHVHRERNKNADGTWTISFKETITRPDGKTKTVAWSRIEAADRSQTGSGTIVRFDGSTVAITITRTADGSVTVKITDADAKVDATISKNEDDTKANVTVTDESKGKVTGTVTVSDTESVEPSDK